LGAYVTGYQTPANALPASGTAGYGGTHNVTAVVSSFGAGGTLNRGVVLGDATYTADFGAGTLTGNFTNMKVANGNVISATPWNDVSVSASIARSTNSFSGSVTAGAIPGGADSNAVTAGSAGIINGGFYGDTAQELAGVWSLKDSSHVVIGVAHGKQGP
jgi:hypothetical protein